MEIFSVRVPDLGTYQVGGSITSREGKEYGISRILANNNSVIIYSEEGEIARITATSYEVIFNEPIRKKVRVGIV